jgi:hypothetical protein
MSEQLGVKTIWKDRIIKDEFQLLDVSHLVEDPFDNFIKRSS